MRGCEGPRSCGVVVAAARGPQCRCCMTAVSFPGASRQGDSRVCATAWAAACVACHGMVAMCLRVSFFAECATLLRLMPGRLCRLCRGVCLCAVLRRQRTGARAALAVLPVTAPFLLLACLLARSLACLLARSTVRASMNAVCAPHEPAGRRTCAPLNMEGRACTASSPLLPCVHARVSCAGAFAQGCVCCWQGGRDWWWPCMDRRPLAGVCELHSLILQPA
jgi:hypothetical protein